MKGIELTDTQRNKLLIMSKTLFPYNDIVSEGSWIYFSKKQIRLASIPWIEFLLTKFQIRLYKIYDTYINGTGADYFEELIISNGINADLIDKMYAQFKQIDDKTFEYYNLKRYDNT